MMARRAWVGAAVMCLACGAEAPKVVTPPPLHITATPPAPTPERARWVFATADRGVVAKLDLDDGSTLYIGRSGRRELAKDGQLTDAPTLAAGDLVGVLRDGEGRFVFVAGDGATYVSKDALGPLGPSHPGPLAASAANGKRLYVATGRGSIVAIAPGGAVVRSTDFGVTWKPVDYAGPKKPYGHAGAVAFDAKGNGVLLHFPQRLFVTHDDGGTWAPLGSLHIGARTVRRDGDERIFVVGFRSAYAKLDGNALVATKEAPKAIYPAAAPRETTITAPGEPESSRTIVTGKRFVEFSITGQGKGRAVQIGSAPLGEKIDKRTTNVDLTGEGGLSEHIAGWGPELVYLRADDDADASAPTTTVLRSKDYGATWQTEAQLAGAEAGRSEGVDVAAGPKGWAYVTALCPKGVSSGSACSRRQIHPAGAKGFEDLAFVEEFEPLEFAFDEAHDKVYAVGLREGHKHLYVSPLAQNKFVRTALLDATAYAPTNLAVDAKGVAHVLTFDGAHGAWVLRRGDGEAKEAPAPEYLSLDRGTMVFAGARGVLFLSQGEGFETADAGESWTRIATNGYPRSLACAEAGCINGDAQRVGWDLPALHGETITATADPPRADAATHPPPPSTPTTEVTCVASGPTSPLTSTPGGDMVDGATTDRWASTKRGSDGKKSLVFGTKNAVHELPLLGALAKPAHGAPNLDVREGERVLSDGVVVARYSFLPRRATGTYNPVDVELAWWSATTGRTHHQTLPKLTPFRVSRYGFSGRPEIVDGGLVFQGATSDGAYFIRDDGKVERIALPAASGDRQIERIGSRWLVADGDGGAVELSASDDAGKTWKRTGWGIDSYGETALSRAGNRASLWFGRPSSAPLLFDVDPSLPDDPPAPTEMSLIPEAACDAHAGHRRVVTYLPSSERVVHVQVDNGKGADKWKTSFLATSRVTHDAPGGKTCASAYTMHGTDTHGGHYDYQSVFVYPDPSGTWTGWRFRGANGHGSTSYVAEPLTCKVAR